MESLLPLANGNRELAQRMADKYLSRRDAVAPRTSTPVAAFYQNSNFGGETLGMNLSDTSFPDLSQETPNLYNEISSVQCLDYNFYIQLCSLINYGGVFILMRYPTTATNLEDYNFNDAAESIQAVNIGNTPTISIFKDINGGGASNLYLAGVTLDDMSSTLVGSNALSSVTLAPNCSVILWTEINCEGSSLPLSNDTAGFITYNMTDYSFNDKCNSFSSSVIQ